MAGAKPVMRRGRVLALTGSVALHLGVLAAALLLAASLRQPEPLFVDLTAGPQPGDERPTPPAASRGRDAAAPAARKAVRASPPLAAAPAPVRSAETSVAAPAPLLSASREAAVTDPAASSAAAPGPSTLAAAPEGGAARGVASDAPTGSGQSSSAGGGSRLALAGAGAGRTEVPAEFGPYLAGFRQRIQELVVYPLAARRRGLAGRVEIEVILEPTGLVRDITVVASSSHSLLDEAAVNAVRSLPPLPLPEHLPMRPLRVRLPVVFDLR